MSCRLKLGACTGFLVVVCTPALADGIINGTFEFQRTCPWQAFKLTSPAPPLVLAPGGNPCSFLRIKTLVNEDGAIVRQDGFLVKVQNGDWVRLEFDARVSGVAEASASVLFTVTGADPIFREIPDSAG